MDDSPVQSTLQSTPPPLHWLRRHFARYQSLRPWPFCWRVTLESFVLSLIIATPLSFFGHSGLSTLTNLPLFLAVALAVVIAPLWETLAFQVLPVAIARRFHARFLLQIGISTALFAVAHYLTRGPNAAITAGLVGGFYLSFCFATWWPRSGWTALWTTGLSHALNNAAAIALLVIFSGGWPGPKHDLAMNCASGGSANLTCWYFWKPHGNFAFAIVGPEESLHTIQTSDLWANFVVGGVSSPFELRVGGIYRRVTYNLEKHRLTIAGRTFDLRKANAIFVRMQGARLTFDPRMMKLNPALFRKHTAWYTFDAATTTFADYAQPPFVKDARQALPNYLKTKRRHHSPPATWSASRNQGPVPQAGQAGTKR